MNTFEHPITPWNISLNVSGAKNVNNDQFDFRVLNLLKY